MSYEFFVFILCGALSIISVILGFIALVKQKTYIDQETLNPTEVEVPLFGKLKTNYPSLAFVFLGFALAFYIVSSCQNMTDMWQIKGRFISDNPNQEWSPACLNLEPRPVKEEIDRLTGEFDFTLEIPSGEKFEDVYSVIGYTDGNMSATIPTLQALHDFRAGGSKYIEIIRPKYRRYRPVSVENLK